VDNHEDFPELRPTTEAYIAIGRHVVKFSQLIARMRFLISQRITNAGNEPREYVELLMAEASATPIANAFFGLCRLVGDLDDDERLVASRLQNAVQRAIEYRNHIAHRDWWVGRVADEVEEDPLITHLHPMSGKGDFEKEIPVPPAELEERTRALLSLTALVMEFGHLSLKLPIPIVVEPRGHVQIRVAAGEFRVRDSLAVHGAKEQARVVRAGPEAKRILSWTYDTY
jgi:hypothetical protein